LRRIANIQMHWPIRERRAGSGFVDVGNSGTSMLAMLAMLAILAILAILAMMHK
jgi:hypothetical protein